MDDKHDASRCPKAGPSHRTVHEGNFHRHKAFVVRETWRARCVVRLKRAERTRRAGHRAAAYDAISFYC